MELHLPLGERAAQGSEEFGQDLLGRRLGGADDDRPGAGDVETGEGLVVHREDATGLGQQLLAREREPRPPPVALDEGLLQTLLEGTHVLAHGGLAHVERDRGTSESAALVDRDERAELDDVEGLGHAWTIDGGGALALGGGHARSHGIHHAAR